MALRFCFTGACSNPPPSEAASTVMAPAPPVAHKFRTPDVVKFAVSPQVGQAVLAFARSYSSSGPD
jgi:hypothetical protein